MALPVDGPGLGAAANAAGGQEQAQAEQQAIENLGVGMLSAFQTIMQNLMNDQKEWLEDVDEDAG